MLPSTRALSVLIAVLSSAAWHPGEARGATFTMGSYIIVDNLSATLSGDASYSHVGFTFNEFGVAVADGFDRDRVAGSGGAGSVATFSFGSASGEPALGAGMYDVYTSWKSPAQANLGVGSYSATDGFATVQIDQSVGSLAAIYAVGRITLGNPGFPADMVQFVHLGQAQILDGDFVVTLTDTDVGTFVFADAIAISLVPEPSGTALLLCAACVLFAARRKRRRRPRQ